MIQLPKLSQFKIVVFDMDGTLLTSDYQLLPENQLAVQKIKSLGLRVTVATGRSYPSAKPFLDQLDIIEPMIFSNGSVADNPDTGEREVIAGVPLETALIILMLANQFEGISIKVHTAEGEVLKSNNIPWPDEGIHFSVGTIIENLQAHLTEDPIKMVIYSSEDQKVEFQQRLNEVLGPKSLITMFHSHPLYLEIVNRNISKGVTATKVLEKLGINVAEAIAVGDQENDYDMLKTLGFGIQVGNSTEKLKPVADHQIPTPEENGIMHLYNWLKQLPIS